MRTRRKLITETQTAELLNVSTRTLKRWRREEINLPFHHISGMIRYDQADVDGLIDNTKRQVVA